MRKILEFIDEYEDKIEAFIGFGFATCIGLGLIVLSFML